MTILLVFLFTVLYCLIFLWAIAYKLNSSRELKNKVYKSPWKYGYRYCIYVDPSGMALNVAFWKRYWNRMERIESSSINQVNIQDLYTEAHKWGQLRIQANTKAIERVKELKIYGKKKSVLAKVVSVCTKYNI